MATDRSKETAETQYPEKADDGSLPQKHPSPPPFDPVPSSHAVPPSHATNGSGHVHSVVPDLMRVYESLTKGNPDDAADSNRGHRQDKQQGSPPAPEQQQQRHHGQESTQYQHLQQQQESQINAHTQSRNVECTYVASEEHYRQLYQRQHQGPGAQMPRNQSQEQMPSSLRCIPVPYDANCSTTAAANISAQTHRLAAPQETTASTEGIPCIGDSSKNPSRGSSGRKRAIAAVADQQGQQQDGGTKATAIPAGGRPRGRKKAKDTDGRWSKRFTWPEELHRDFVSAVFDVGLKHSSPSTILEHMPKHPQITSERIKSHLQKYRVHRTKSKQEFMSSYESTLKKFKGGQLHNVKSLSSGETAAHLTHTVRLDVSDPASRAKNSASVDERSKKGSEWQHRHSPAGAQGEAAVAHAQQPPQRGLPSPLGPEAIMLPKLTEAEKTSPIGASMGYLLGLFFSLKKQLLVQRGLNSSRDGDGNRSSTSVPVGMPIAVRDEAIGSAVGVYESSVGAVEVDGSSNPNVPDPVVPLPTGPAAYVTAASMDWTSSNSANTGVISGGLGAPSTAPLTPNPAVSALNNLEASSMMKREMESQMAFQNKMRALKQQELNKYKGLSANLGNNADSGIGSVNCNIPGGRELNDSKGSSVRFVQEGGEVQRHDTNMKEANLGESRCMSDAGEANSASHAIHIQTPQPQDPHSESNSGGCCVEESYQNFAKGSAHGMEGDSNVQGAGETASAARARALSFSMGGNDDFWSADIMDDQLFEFLMNN